MIKLNLSNLQHFAHKKVEVQLLTDVIHKQNVLALRQLMDKQFQEVQSFTVNAAHIFILVLTLVVAEMILFLLRLKVLYALSVRDAIRNKFLYTQSQNNVLKGHGIRLFCTLG
ncbi:Uncharacterised protein [Streptococcus equi subsp. equi]|nr:Uncharacterised protein [Streptococcus equi subsp. equi]